MAKGDTITFTALKECEYCSVVKQEGTAFGAAFDTETHDPKSPTRKPGFFDLFGASLAGYEPRNGTEHLTPCACFENCGVKKPRETTCFVHVKGVDPLQADLLIPCSNRFYPI